jgi:hypothetical protein
MDEKLTATEVLPGGKRQCQCFPHESLHIRGYIGIIIGTERYVLLILS